MTFFHSLISRGSWHHFSQKCGQPGQWVKKILTIFYQRNIHNSAMKWKNWSIACSWRTCDMRSCFRKNCKRILDLNNLQNRHNRDMNWNRSKITLRTDLLDSHKMVWSAINARQSIKGFPKKLSPCVAFCTIRQAQVSCTWLSISHFWIRVQVPISRFFCWSLFS